MPQESLKSAVYRSFVTCDDPKGVVECKTMRKSRPSSQKMDHKIESRRSTSKNSDTSSMAYKAEKEEMQQLSKGFKKDVNHSPSSFQLMEVSRGVQKLNGMIDSWTKGVRFDGQSKDIAQDLLKGALDLQESLIMLGKLQEASQFMAELETKQNEKSEMRRIDEVGIERIQSSEFGHKKRRHSADGSSRDHHIEELRKVIRDSFARQNLLPNPTTTEEMGYLHLRDLDSASEIPSTTSSQSLMVRAYDFGALQKKAKGPNLIAKLMGLDDLPSKPLRTPLQKHLESERILNQRRHVFNIVRPRGRKPHSNADPERRTLKKILETMKFKGLLKSDSVKELKPQYYHSNDSHSKQGLIDEIPPIVLIKPSMEELHTPVLQVEEALNTKKMLRKLKRKEKLPSKTHKEGALSSKKMHRKMEAVETPIKTLSLEEGTKHKEVVRKPEEKKVKSKEKASNKLKATGPLDQKLQKKEATDKKAHKIQKVVSPSGKPSEMENVKAKIVSESEDQAKTSTKPRKHENGSNIINNQTRRPSTIQNSISKLPTKTTISSSTDQKKNQTKKTNPVREPIAAKPVIENFGSKEDDKRINLGSENCSPVMRTDTSLADQLPIEEDKDASESHVEVVEHCSNSQSSLSDVIPLRPKYEIDDQTAEEAYNHIFHSRTGIKSFKSGNNLEALLLSSPSFLSRAEELFYLNVRNPSSINDLVVANVKLSLECANELIERKSLRDSHTVHPLLLTSVGNLRVCISIDNLVGEVCKGVENLRSYSNLAGESLPVDGIYAMLERDISCNGVENAIWDFSWRHGFSVDDAEQVVNEIEKLLFDGLIEEVFT